MPDQRVDRDALHLYLYERSNSRSHIPIHQTELAEKLDITRGTMYRVIKEMVDAGRMRKVESLERNVKVYQIVDPAVWKAGEPHLKVTKRVVWG